MKLNRQLALFATVVCVPLWPAAACPDGQSSTSLGFCLPNAGGDGAKFLEDKQREIYAQTYGPQIAAWFEASRATSAPASQPVPPYIRQMLTGFVSEDVLNRARYKVGDNGLINGAGIILKVNDDVGAVALIDVIVFRDGADAQSNAKLWAHELKHVQQFMEWGSRDFGIRYARNYNAVEEQARNEENRYDNWLAQRASINSPPPVQPPIQPPPVTMAKVCVTPYMYCMMAAVGPTGLPCYCPTPAGPVWGQSM